MTVELPPSIEKDDELAIHWERDEFSTKIVVTLGEASVTVEASEDGASTVPWLLAMMPRALEAAWAEIEDHDNQQEAP